MPPLVLNDDEVHQLQSIANSRSLPHSIVQRAQIVLACGAGETNTSIANRMGLSSDIRFWSSGDTKTGPPDGLLMGALRRPLDRCFIDRCRVVCVGCGICAA
jgi:putative transposase